MNFNRIRKNYETKLWTKEMVKQAVKRGIISESEYFIIVNEMYKE